MYLALNFKMIYQPTVGRGEYKGEEDSYTQMFAILSKVQDTLTKPTFCFHILNSCFSLTE